MTNKKRIPDDIRAQLKKDYATVQDFIEKGKEETEENEATKVKNSYSWKAAALEILEEMRQILLGLVDNDDDEADNEAVLMLAIVYLNQSTTASGIDRANMPDEAKKYSIEKAKEDVDKSLTILSRYDIDSKIVIPMISVLHQLAFFLLEENHIEKAKKYIEQAESVYDTFKSSQHTEPVSMSSIFGITDLQKPSANFTLEELHMGTYYYFTQLYGIIGSADKTVIYCVITMKKQLEINDIDTIDWTLGYWKYILTKIFSNKKDFSFQNARQWLAGATCVLEQYEKILKGLSAKDPLDDSEQYVLDSKWKYFKQVSSQIARLWAKYGLTLLSKSVERLSKNDSTNQEPFEKQLKFEVKINQKYLDKLNLHEIKSDMERLVNDITDKYVRDFDDAKPVFIKSLKWLNDAKSYYTIEDHIEEHGIIIIEIAELYKFLISFEKDKDRQAKMHKRRIDLLEGILKEFLERQFSTDYRSILVDLGSSYSAILNIKLERLKETNTNATPQSLSKINNLAKSAIFNYTRLIKSLGTPSLQKYPDDKIQLVLCSYYYIGKLYRKFVLPNDCTESDKQKQAENHKKSLDAFKYIIDYCKKYPRAAEFVKDELILSKHYVEMYEGK